MDDDADADDDDNDVTFDVTSDAIAVMLCYCVYNCWWCFLQLFKCQTTLNLPKNFLNHTTPKKSVGLTKIKTETKVFSQLQPYVLVSLTTKVSVYYKM